MIRISGLRFSADGIADIRQIAAKALNMSSAEIQDVCILRKSLDCRRKSCH
ncbi:MAG: hypothetical protein K2M44_05875 [Clostridia bacterium]|nr:hypothetical protein [Clostridia bacterium]